MPSKARDSGNSSSDNIAAGLAALPGPLGIVGYGVEGRETLRFLAGRGLEELRVFDRALDKESIREGEAAYPGTRFIGEGDWEGLLPRCGTLFRSPGIRPDLPALLAARASGARVTSAVRLFLGLNPGRAVGVTGTVGKGTTVTLIGEGLRAAGLSFRLGGNIGINPLAFLHEMTSAHVAVLELSSFQLMDLEADHPEVAVVLRTSSEHLDWHLDLSEYRAGKGRLLAPAGAGQRIVYCADSEGSRQIAAGGAAHGADSGADSGAATRDVTGEEHEVVQLEGRALAYSLTGPVTEGVGWNGSGFSRMGGGREEPLPQLERLTLPAEFNIENAAAALLAAELLGAAPKITLPALAAFPGLPHRLERVGEINGMVCYNDSYATRPEATLGALGAFDQPLAAILGGSEKFADFSQLAEALCLHKSLRLTVLTGSTTERLHGEILRGAARLGCKEPPVARAAGLAQALELAGGALAGGGVLLFSPACASFDQFTDYKERGESFRRLVERIAAEKSG